MLRKNFSHPWFFLVTGIVLLLAAGVAWYFLYSKNDDANTQTDNTTTSIPKNVSAPENTTNTANTTTQNTATQKPAPEMLAAPIDAFRDRITKKKFGTYVTPQNSPVQPERFSGYHNAVDVEYGDIKSDVAVYALADCKVVASRTTDGYGGVFVVSFTWKGNSYTALYGHIRPSTLPSIGKTYKRGEKIAVLGTAFSSETDGERRHLHFSIHPGSSINIKGYVQNRSELSAWIDPLTLY